MKERAVEQMRQASKLLTSAKNELLMVANDEVTDQELVDALVSSIERLRADLEQLIVFTTGN